MGWTQQDKNSSWTSEESKVVIGHHQEGKSPGEIVPLLKAAGFDRNKDQIRAYIYRKVPNDRRKRKDAIRQRTAETRLKARELSRSGLTAFQVAKSLGVSRAKVYADVPRPLRAPDRSRFEAWLRLIRPGRVIEPEPITSDGFSFAELESHQCRWGIGVNEDGHHQFCGKQRAEGKRYQPYCAAHTEDARFVPPPEQIRRRFNNPLLFQGRQQMLIRTVDISRES